MTVGRSYFRGRGYRNFLDLQSSQAARATNACEGQVRFIAHHFQFVRDIFSDHGGSELHPTFSDTPAYVIPAYACLQGSLASLYRIADSSFEVRR